jgi:hypothetical protein
MAPDAKGRALENAVHAIEAVILASSPALREQPFTIEARKIITVGSVHHEIDIFVTVEAAKGYTATFIFECKNWQAAVGKNEIIVFSEKIGAASAQRGYFVAKSFTKDAEAQALKDARVTLLTATEHDPATTILPDLFHITAPATSKSSTTFRALGSAGTNMAPITVPGTKVRLYGNEILLSNYLTAWTWELYEERLLGFSTAHLAEGVYPMPCSAERFFGVGECVINGQEMEHVRLDAEFGVHIMRPLVISHYEVATRGRAVRLANVNVHDLVIGSTLVQTLTN